MISNWFTCKNYLWLNSINGKILPDFQVSGLIFNLVGEKLIVRVMVPNNKMMRKLLFLGFALFGFSWVNAQSMNEVQGNAAAPSLTTGNFNTVYGDSAAFRLTTANGHVVIGAGAGMNITTSGNPGQWHYNPNLIFSFPPASGNIFIGQGAGYSNTTALDNVFIGSHSGWSTTLGSDNVFVGAHTGWNNSTGFRNTFVGDAAGSKNTFGRQNTFIGANSGLFSTTGASNTFVGYSAGNRNTTGFQNTFVGDDAGFDNTTGFYNSCFGDSAGIDMGVTTGNTMIGHASGAATEHADYNTFVGNNSGWDNNRLNNTDDANGNTYVGNECGYSNRIGEYNIMMGYKADFEQSGVRSTGQPKTQNNYNIAIGYLAILGQAKNHGIQIGQRTYISENYAMAIGDSSRNSGLNSIALGRQTNVSGENSIAIGYGSTVTANNEVYIGNLATVAIGGPVNWTATSDQRMKTNVQEDVVGLDFINRLRPVTYQFDMDVLSKGNIPADLAEAVSARGQVRYTGFLAQEVEAAAAASNYDFSGVDKPESDEDNYGLRYAEFTVPLVKSVQELSTEVETLKAELAQKNAQIDALLEKYEDLSSRVGQIEQGEKVMAENK